MTMPTVGACELADQLRDQVLDFMRAHPGYSINNALAAVRIVEGFCLYTIKEGGEEVPAGRVLNLATKGRKVG